MTSSKPLSRVVALVASVLVANQASAQDGTPIGVPEGTPRPADADAAPAAAPGPSAAPAPQPYEEKPAPPPSWPQRSGFTLDLGLGPAYTTAGGGAYSGGFGLGGLSLSLGGFVSRRVAIVGRAAGTTFFEDVEVRRTTGFMRTSQSTSTRAILAAFYGPAVQVFPSDRVFLSGGAGLGVLAPSYFAFDVDDSLPKPKVGFAMNARVGLGLLARAHHWLGVVFDLTPGFYGKNGTTFGSAVLLQWQYY